MPLQLYKVQIKWEQNFGGLNNKFYLLITLKRGVFPSFFFNLKKSNIKIRKAVLSDLQEIMRIISLCTKHMISKKIFQWDENYPSKNIFKEDIDNGYLMVLLLKSDIIGCVSVSNIMDDFYKKIEWKIKSNDSLYVHRLAINPTFQGKGFAKFIMKYIEEIGIKTKAKSIRLDTFSLNKKNNKFYSNLGYLKLGQIYFRNQSDMPFNCYEKVLK